MNDTACEEDFKKYELYSNFVNFSNYNYVGNPEVWKKLDYVDAIKISAYIIVIVGGLLGNITIILTVAFKRSMWNTINFYVANLAVTDAMICLVCMVPHLFHVFTNNLFILGAFMCKFSPFMEMTCMTCSVLMLSAISCDRFMAVIFPFRSRITKQRTSVVMTIIWTISIAVSIPFFIVKSYRIAEWKDFEQPQCYELWPGQHYYDEVRRKCLKHRPLFTIYYVASSLILFFLPVLIMIASYSLILRRLWLIKAPGEQNAAIVNTYSRARKKVIKMVFVVLIVFIICWGPYQVMILYFTIQRSRPAWMYKFRWFARYLAYANSFMNPIIYSGFNKGFREVFFGVLECGYGRDRYHSTVRRKIFNIRGTWSPTHIKSDTMKSSKKMKVKYQVTDIDTSSTTIDTCVSTIDEK